MKKVTGIGGIFFKSQNPNEMNGMLKTSACPLVIMALPLNGAKPMTFPNKDQRHGALFRRILSISTHHINLL